MNSTEPVTLSVPAGPAPDRQQLLPPVHVAAKSGSLLGIIRGEIGVICYPDSRQYAAAVFTRSQPGSDDAAISRAISTAPAHAVATLRRLKGDAL